MRIKIHGSRFEKRAVAIGAAVIVALSGASLAVTPAAAAATPTKAVTAKVAYDATHDPSLVTSSNRTAPPVCTPSKCKPIGSTKLKTKGSPQKPGASHSGNFSARSGLCVAPLTPCYFYNTALDTPATPDTIWQGNTVIGSPFLETQGTNPNHSLGQLAAIQNNGASRQIIEVGWSRDKYGLGGGTNVNPIFFVSSWKNSVCGCYQTGFVDYAGTGPNFGDSLTAGDQWQFRIQSVTTGTQGWWIWAGKFNGTSFVGDWVGYFPFTIWTASPSVTFNTFTSAQAFWENADYREKPCSDMGNGILGGSATLPLGAGDPTWWASLTASNHTPNIGAPVITQSPAGVPALVGSSTSTLSTRTFAGGGPLWNNSGTGQGATNSC